MHLRLTSTRRGNRTYTYAQLVQSYRRDDGMPAHRVIASLGALSEVEIANLRAALDASRKGSAVVIPDVKPSPRRALKVHASLDWLALAVLDALWHELGIDDLLPLESGADVSMRRVIETLVLHRVTAAGSKLSAIRWFPTTALPELFGISIPKLNNTRIHRALEALDHADDALQQRLAQRVHGKDGGCLALFLDVTDTWFEGRGPEMAAPGRDKEGIYRRRIGILLLCDQRGYPIRWTVLAGDYRDADAMSEMCRKLAGLDWLRDIPLVMDRAMGRAGTVSFLADTGLRYLTALPVDEFETTGAAIPWQALEDVEPEGTDESRSSDVERAAVAAQKAGMERVSRTRYVIDLGVIEKRMNSGARAKRGPSRAVVALDIARRIAAEPHATNTQLAKAMGLSRKSIINHRQLGSIVDAVQQRIAAGEADTLTVGHLYQIAALPALEQATALDDALTDASASKSLTPTSKHPGAASAPMVRCVVHFNPERFVEQRAIERRQVAELQALVDGVNAKIREPECKKQDKTVLATITDRLGRLAWREVYEVRLLNLPDGGRLLELVRNDQEWARRRRYDGFNLLVGRPDLPHSAAELVALYFAKDAVEKDFQTIKSEIELHPVRHRTDPKVRAHVTLCMLALLLERHLERRLRDGGRQRSAPSALELLTTCRLNQIDDDGAPIYTITEANPDQRDLLTALELADLARDEFVGQLLTAR